MTLIRVGVVGAGLMGEVHARNVAGRSATARLVAVADADEPRAQALAAELGAAGCYADAHQLIAAPDVDAVIIASPDATHAEYAHACLAERKPVLCEKPLASTVDDAWEIASADAAVGREAGRRLVQVGFMREFDPAHAAVRDAVSAGAIGRPLMFRGTHINPFSFGPMSAQRCITQSMIHDFHSAHFLTGRSIVSVYARAVGTWAPNEAGLVTVTCTFDDGSIGMIDVNSWSGYGYEVSAEVTGEIGVVATVLPALAVTRRAGSAATDVTPTWADRFSQAYQIELDAWLASLTSGVAVGPGAWEGYVANAVADAACRSFETGLPEAVVLRPLPV